MKMNTKHISIFLLALASIPLLASFLISIHSLWIKHEMVERMENETLHKIVLQKENVHWVEKGSELLIHGELFDVKHYSIENNLLIGWGIFDKEETRLSIWVEKNNKSKDDLILSNIFLALEKMQYFGPSSLDSIAFVSECAVHFANLGFNLPSPPFIPGSHPPPNGFCI
jgi:hypothetical protein